MKFKGRRGLGALAIVASASLMLGACGSSDSASKPDSSKLSIAFVGALTGDSASLGVNVRNGIKTAIEEANAKGGTQITLKEYDTKGDPAEATTVKDKFIDDSNVVGVVGPVFSGETKAVLSDLQQAGLVMISPSATNVALPTVVKDQTVFHRVIPDDAVQGQGVTDYIVKKLAAKKVAYIHDNSDYGKGLAEGTMATVSAAGVATAVEDAVDPKSQDFSAAVNKVKTSGADVVFYGGYYTEAGRFRKQLVDAGVKTTFLTGDGALDPGFIASAGSAQAEGAQITCPCNVATADAPGRLGEFARSYKKINNADPGTYSTESYDAANILIEGIKSGNTTREKLLNHVENLGVYDGVGKKIEFEANGNVKSAGVFFFQAKGGKLVLLGSSEELIK